MDHLCSVCKLPFRSIQFDKATQRPKQPFSAQQCRQACDAGRWWDDVLLLCDPDDEAGQLDPSLRHENLNRSWQNPAPDQTSSASTSASASGSGSGSAGSPSHHSTAARPRSQATDIEIHRARYEGECRFRILGLGHDGPGQPEVEVACLRGGHEPNGNIFDGRVYLPVHAACLDVARKVWAASAGNDNAYVKDLRGLFLVLRWRNAVEVKCGESMAMSADSSINFDLACNHHYAPIGHWWDWREDDDHGHEEFDDDASGDGDGDEDEDGDEDGTGDDHDADAEEEWGPPGEAENEYMHMLLTFATSPYAIHDLTDILLLNLEECPARNESSTAAQAPGSFMSRLASLPTEITDVIFDYVRSPRGLPHTTTGLLPQSFWKDQLKSTGANLDAGLLPWLWDVDAAKIEAKASSPCSGRPAYEWNWELLVRKLTKGVDFAARNDWRDSFDPYPSAGVDNGVLGAGPWTYTGYHDDLAHVPIGLHNRRRVWQLLEEMFVGDTLPWPPARYDVPAYGAVQEPREKFMRLHWGKRGDFLSVPRWLPSIKFAEGPFRRRGFFRKIGGGGGVKLVESRRPKGPLQYWQYGEDGTPLEKEAAKVEDIYEVLRRLGYPL